MLADTTAVPGWAPDKTKLLFQTGRKKTIIIFWNPAFTCLFFPSSPPETHRSRDLTRLALRVEFRVKGLLKHWPFLTLSCWNNQKTSPLTLRGFTIGPQILTPSCMLKRFWLRAFLVQKGDFSCYFPQSLNFQLLQWISSSSSPSCSRSLGAGVKNVPQFGEAFSRHRPHSGGLNCGFGSWIVSQLGNTSVCVWPGSKQYSWSCRKML